MTQSQALMLVDRLSRLLRDEIAAIGQGKLARVEELYPEKTRLLAEIESVFADPDALVGGQDAPAQKLKERLGEMRELIHQDLALLKRMTEATGAVAREIERIRERQSLRGLYGPDGSSSDKGVATPQRLDQSI